MDNEPHVHRVQLGRVSEELSNNIHVASFVVAFAHGSCDY